MKRSILREEGLPLTSKESIYMRFLIFKEFYSAPAPIVLCEGKTDNVYITHAIRSLARQYPQLADVSPAERSLSSFGVSDIRTGVQDESLEFTAEPGSWVFHSNLQKGNRPIQSTRDAMPNILLIDNDAGKKRFLVLFNRSQKTNHKILTLTHASSRISIWS